MSNWTAAYRRIEATQRREERAAQKHRRDLERRLKEIAKLSALEAARLEVEAYENSIDVVLSVHKEQSPPINWASLASALPPHPPSRIPRNEVAAGFNAMLKLVNEPRRRIIVAAEQANSPDEEAEHARHLDDAAHDAARAAYITDAQESEKRPRRTSPEGGGSRLH